jgi:WD40 repeat protein
MLNMCQTTHRQSPEYHRLIVYHSEHLKLISLHLLFLVICVVHSLWQSGSPVATFKHHTQPVTTVEWHPTEATLFASGGCDDQIALWDLALERDTEDCKDDIKVSSYFHSQSCGSLFGTP